MIVIDPLMKALAKDGNGMQTLIAEILTSYPFMHRLVLQPVAKNSK